MDELQHLRRLVAELKTTNSSNDKLKILKKFPECKNILRWTYDPFKQYYVTSDNLKKNPHIQTEYKGKYLTFTSIYDLLEALDSRKITGHEALASIWHFINSNLAYAELILNILDRNLKVRVDAKLINKVWPSTVPQFDVALANKYDDCKGRVNFQKDTWLASRKLDGVRVITILDKSGGIKFLSRKGKEFFTLGKVKEEFKKKFQPSELANGSIVFDGEMCIVNKNGDENFADIIKLIRRKDFTIAHPKYKIFDCMILEVFEGTAPPSLNAKLSSRLKVLNLLRKKDMLDGNVLDTVEQRLIKSEKDLEEFMTEAIAKKWEGLILRKDVPYEGKRSNDMLKVKKMQDAEFVVKDVEMGPIRIIENGLEVERVMLSAIKIPYRGNIVSVGSGFSIEQRQEFFKDPSKILGKTVTIAYFEETLNEQGNYSLRFPVLKAIYDGKRDV
jgi:DNA ligase-1